MTLKDWEIISKVSKQLNWRSTFKAHSKYLEQLGNTWKTKNTEELLTLVVQADFTVTSDKQIMLQPKRDFMVSPRL